MWRLMLMSEKRFTVTYAGGAGTIQDKFNSPIDGITVKEDKARRICDWLNENIKSHKRFYLDEITLPSINGDSKGYAIKDNLTGKTIKWIPYLGNDDMEEYVDFLNELWESSPYD